jgi:hypothetical protein
MWEVHVLILTWRLTIVTGLWGLVSLEISLKLAIAHSFHYSLLCLQIQKNH